MEVQYSIDVGMPGLKGFNKGGSVLVEGRLDLSRSLASPLNLTLYLSVTSDIRLNVWNSKMINNVTCSTWACLWPYRPLFYSTFSLLRWFPWIRCPPWEKESEEAESGSSLYIYIHIYIYLHMINH
jgi:hypothetical protein